MKKLLFIVIFLLANILANGQNLVQTYLDPCDNKVYVVTVPINSPGTLIVIRNESKIFSYKDISNGLAEAWIKSIFAKPCPVNQQTTQVITQTAVTAATAAASSAAASAASSAASSIASSAASSSASSAATSSASTAASGSVSAPTTTSTSSTSSSNTESSSSSSSSSSSESSSSESKTESKSESSESKSESKSEEKKEESKSEEKKEEKKESKKENKKEKAGITNPVIVSADLSLAEQAPNRSIVPVMNTGLSKSSMTGMSNWGISASIFMDLSKIALTGRYGKNETDEKGELIAVHTFSNTYFTDYKNHMVFLAYTYVQPINKLITGYNISLNQAFIQGGQINFSPSIIGFAMYPIQIKRKTITPDLFLISSPYSYSFNSKIGVRNRDLIFLTGFSTDVKLTKKFKINLNFKVNVGTNKASPALLSSMIGSKINI